MGSSSTSIRSSARSRTKVTGSSHSVALRIWARSDKLWMNWLLEITPVDP